MPLRLLDLKRYFLTKNQSYATVNTTNLEVFFVFSFDKILMQICGSITMLDYRYVGIPIDVSNCRCVRLKTCRTMDVLNNRCVELSICRTIDTSGNYKVMPLTTSNKFQYIIFNTNNKQFQQQVTKKCHNTTNYQ